MTKLILNWNKLMRPDADVICVNKAQVITVFNWIGHMQSPNTPTVMSGMRGPLGAYHTALVDSAAVVMNIFTGMGTALLKVREPIKPPRYHYAECLLQQEEDEL